MLGMFLTLWIGAVIGTPLLVLCALRGNASAATALAIFGMYRSCLNVRGSSRVRRWMALAPRPYLLPLHVRYVKHDDDASRDTRTFYGFHPHGVLSIGWCHACSLAEFDANDTHFLASRALLALPGAGELLRLAGIRPSDRSTFKQLMHYGNNLAILIGGFEEAALFKRNAYRVFCKQRKGFIKYLLQHGYHVRPVFIFGEEKTYWALQAFPKLRMWLAKHGIPGVAFIGFGHMPDFRHGACIAIGRRLHMPRSENPSTEEVDYHHGRYIDALREAFDCHKAEFAVDHNAQLEIF